MSFNPHEHTTVLFPHLLMATHQSYQSQPDTRDLHQIEQVDSFTYIDRINVLSLKINSHIPRRVCNLLIKYPVLHLSRGLTFTLPHDHSKGDRMHIGTLPHTWDWLLLAKAWLGKPGIVVIVCPLVTTRADLVIRAQCGLKWGPRSDNNTQEASSPSWLIKIDIKPRWHKSICIHF